MKRDELTREMQRAIAFYCGSHSSMTAAEAALSAIESAGFRIVPAEPTTAQLSAGQTAWINDPMRLSSTLYRAMVAASPINAKGGET